MLGISILSIYGKGKEDEKSCLGTVFYVVGRFLVVVQVVAVDVTLHLLAIRIRGVAQYSLENFLIDSALPVRGIHVYCHQKRPTIATARRTALM